MNMEKCLIDLQFRTKMIVNLLKWMCFHGNETNICVTDSIFSGSAQQNVYFLLAFKWYLCYLENSNIHINKRRTFFLHKVEKLS